MFLAILMCFSSLIGVAATAYAATKQDVYIIDLPRGKETNKEHWGHPAYELLNGWSTFNTDYVTVKAIGDYEGDSCYCIEPGVPLYTGDKLSKEAESFWDNYPSKYNKTIDPDTIKIFLGRIMQYGYTGKNSVDCEKNKMKEYLEVYDYIFQKQDYNFLMSNTITKSAKRCSKYLSANLSDNRLKESNVLGIGASSRGRFGLLYYKNTVDINEYMRNVKKHGFSIECKQVYQKEDMEDRLLVMFPNFTKIEKKEVNRLQKHRIDQLNNLVDLGFVLENEHEYYLDATGMFFAGNISKKFYSLKERKNTVNMVINNLKHKVNFYNQDNMQINQEVR